MPNANSIVSRTASINVLNNNSSKSNSDNKRGKFIEKNEEQKMVINVN
jgi:hypothetical protein